MLTFVVASLTIVPGKHSGSSAGNLSFYNVIVGAVSLNCVLLGLDLSSSQYRSSQTG